LIARKLNATLLRSGAAAPRGERVPPRGQTQQRPGPDSVVQGEVVD
jgi:hypothetical protein